MLFTHWIKKNYGLNFSRANLIIKHFGFNKNLKIQDLTKDQVLDVKKHINKRYVIDNKLKKDENLFFKFLFVSKHYKSFRFKRGLPVRGQHSHNNGKTIKRKFKHLIKI